MIKRSLTIVIILSCLTIGIIFAQQPIFANGNEKPRLALLQGCDRVDCSWDLQVCNEIGCYWVTRCISGFLVEAKCVAIRNGCSFSWCGWRPVLADGPIYPVVLRTAAISEAADDPFISMGLIQFGEHNFINDGTIGYSVPRYIFGSGEAATYIASWVDNNDPSTRLDYEKAENGSPEKESVSISFKNNSDGSKTITASHLGNIANVLVTNNNGNWYAVLQ